jgi:hypothetical protein
MLGRGEAGDYAGLDLSIAYSYQVAVNNLSHGGDKRQWRRNGKRAVASGDVHS